MTTNTTTNAARLIEGLVLSIEDNEILPVNALRKAYEAGAEEMAEQVEHLTALLQEAVEARDAERALRLSYEANLTAAEQRVTQLLGQDANARSSYEHSLKYYRSKLADAQTVEESTKVVLKDMLAARHEIDRAEIDLDGLDLESMSMRLYELVEGDANPIWELEREYGVSVTLTVVVEGRIRAKSQEEADRLAEDASERLDFELSEDGSLDSANIVNASVEEVSTSSH